MNEETFTSYKIKKMDNIIVSDASVNEFLKEWGRKQVQYQRFVEPINKGISWQEKLGKVIENIIINPKNLDDFQKLPEDMFRNITNHNILKMGWVGTYCHIRIWVDDRVQENDIVYFDMADNKLLKKFPNIAEFFK